MKQYLSVQEIISFREISRKALKLYFWENRQNIEEFFGISPASVLEMRDCRLEELDKSQSLIMLTAIEAMFRVDFLYRRKGRRSIVLSSEFKGMFKKSKERVRLEDIFEAWRNSGKISSYIINDLRHAMKLRHWLAHGRYWTLKSGKHYDFDSLAELARQLVDLNILKMDG